MKKSLTNSLLLTLFLITGTSLSFAGNQKKPVYTDKPYWQDYSIKFESGENSPELINAFSDRNGNIQLLTTKGLYKPHNGRFLYPGTLVPDGSYRTLAHKKMLANTLHQNQFVHMDKEAILSNAWAGKLYIEHGLKKPHILVGGSDFSFLVSDGKKVKYFSSNQEQSSWKNKGEILEVEYTADNDLFWILEENKLSTYSPQTNERTEVFTGQNFTSFEVVAFGSKTIIGTTEGYIEINNLSGSQIGEKRVNIPVPSITAVEEIDGRIWFGTEEGLFTPAANGKFSYYYGKRWLPGYKVSHIAKGPKNSILVTTDGGLGQICFKNMTLADKAAYYQQQVRKRHIRNGFNATLEGMSPGNLSTGYLRDSDNDGLWTSMYLGAEIFRYYVTKSDEALQNCIESLEAMERLYSINPVPGFPSRSFERRGYIEVLADPHRWQHSDHPDWDWKATTSSDEAIGHIFAMGVFAELIDVEPYRTRAVKIIDQLMQHIVDNDFYMIDYDGKPTTWGRWNPEYVNANPEMVGDRKLTSSNITAMLQTAYHFTGKEIYKEKAFELFEDHGYLENLMRPMAEIGRAPEDASEHSKMLSTDWNHSDDEMYFLGYWGLYRYAFTSELKEKYREAIIDHWEIERPEKDGLWNLFTAMVSDEFDLKEAAWYLREYPLDMISWATKNSHRKDIVFIEENFREQTMKEVLPPDEIRVQRHNGNTFRVDGGGNGTSESSAGDIWLLPYWLGRYLGVISEPLK